MGWLLSVIKSIVCGICRVLGGDIEVGIGDPTFVREMDINELSSILLDKFPDVPLYLPDLVYKVCEKKEIERFLAWDNTDAQTYEAEGYDCDDFAWRLKGNITLKPWSSLPFGVVWTNVHALNCFIDADGKFWFVEPQTNKVQEELEPWQGSELRFIAM